MRSHSFLNFIFNVIREKHELYVLSFFLSLTSIQKPVKLFKAKVSLPSSQLFVTSLLIYILGVNSKRPIKGKRKEKKKK